MSPSLIADLFDRCTFDSSAERLVCGVSGGADSMALLVLAAETGARVVAVHVDHGLRDGSDREARRVADLAARLGADFESLTVAVESGPNLEARARRARYDVLPPDVLTGHTADDQAETVLMNIMRGAGLSGLGGMRTTGHPILSLRRHETVALCESVGIEYFVDPSNTDPSILRNRVRHELLPLMSSMAERDVAAVIAAQSPAIHAAVELLDELAASIDPTDARALADAHQEVAARAVRAWIRAETDDEQHPPDSAAVGRVLAVARGEAKGCDVINGLSVTRSQQRLTLSRRDLAAPSKP